MDYKKLFEDLIAVLVQQDGSDIHISSGRIPLIRVNGELIFLTTHTVLNNEDIEGILKTILLPDIYSKFKETKDIDFSYRYQETHRLRGNAYVQQGNISVAFRLIPKVKSIKELGLPDILEEYAKKRQGFFLIVGPVGQGKSATMASMVNTINEDRSCHILTIEDPIEYTFEQNKAIIDQREVGIDVESFETALKSALREDVNAILIGEMRNTETISSAVTAAETGHLVLSTLHTNTAAQTIDRIIDSFPSNQQEQIRIQLSSSLLGIFSQRLVPRIAGGRVPAYEFLINNNAVANLIREKRTHEIDMVIETSSADGMIDMNRSLLELVRKGEITIEDAFTYSPNPKNLERLI